MGSLDRTGVDWTGSGWNRTRSQMAWTGPHAENEGRGPEPNGNPWEGRTHGLTGEWVDYVDGWSDQTWAPSVVAELHRPLGLE